MPMIKTLGMGSAAKPELNETANRRVSNLIGYGMRCSLDFRRGGFGAADYGRSERSGQVGADMFWSVFTSPTTYFVFVETILGVSGCITCHVGLNPLKFSLSF